MISLRSDGGVLLAMALLCAVGWATTVGFWSSLSWFDEQRVVALAWMSAVLAGSALRRTRLTVRAEFGAPLFAALLLGGVSALLSARPGPASIEWATVAAIWLFAVSSRLEERDAILVGIAAAVVPATAYVTAVVARYVSAVSLGYPVGSETFLAGFANPRFPSQLQALTLPFFPLAWSATRDPVRRVGLGIVWTLWWCCLIGSSSRTAWLALLVACVVVVALCGSSGRHWARLQGTAALAGALIFYLAFVLLPPWLGIDTVRETGRIAYTASIDARIALWTLALEMIADAPVLGAGPMHFSLQDNGLGAHPHNWWLQIGAEWGVPALLAFMFLYAQLARRLLASTVQSAPGTAPQSPLAVPLRTATVAAFVCWSIGVLLDGYMVIPSSQMLSALVLALAFAVCCTADAPTVAIRRRPTPDAVAIGVRCLALLALVAIASLPFSTLASPAQREAAWRCSHPSAVLWPRFWGQGWIDPKYDVQQFPVHCASASADKWAEE